MDLYLIRHAPAEERAEGGKDADRALTQKGRRRFQQAVDGWMHLCPSFDLLLHSPWRRAVETAQLLGPATKGELRVTPALARAPDRALLAEIAQGAMEAQLAWSRPKERPVRVALVGHQPWLSELAAWMLFDDPDGAERLPLGKGAMAWMRGELEPGRMTLCALLTPKLLRALA